MTREICTAHPDTWPATLAGQEKKSRFILIYLKAEDGPLWVKAGYDYHGGNSMAYWSITCSGRGRCGCLHEEIVALRPELKPFVDLHLNTVDGLPMHAVENGAYYAKQYLSYKLKKGKEYNAMVASAAIGKSGAALVEAMKEVDKLAEKRAGEQRDAFLRHCLHDAAKQRLFYMETALSAEDLDNPRVYEFIKKHVSNMFDNLKEFYRSKFEELYQLMKAVAKAEIEQDAKPEKTLAELLQEKQVTVSIKPIKKRKDMHDFIDSAARHFSVEITSPSHVVEFEYSAGSAARDPEPADVLHCAIDEHDLYQQFNSFDDFCRNLGYDADSRKALRLWEALESQAKDVEQLMAASDLEEIKLAAEDEMNRRG